MNHKNSWRHAFSIYTKARVLGMIFLGFSAGLPFLLVFSTLSAWLRDDGVNLSVIGFFSWIGITYSIKILWAPVVDSLHLPLFSTILGKRRGWMLLAQIGIACGLVGIGYSDASQLQQIALFALVVAFFSATQDIVIDAYRIEALNPKFQGAMAATYVLGYRIALLFAGAGAFYIADYTSWKIAYYVMAATMSVGIITTLLIKEPKHQNTPKWSEKDLESADNSANKPLCQKNLSIKFIETITGSFVEFFNRNGSASLLILGLIAVYKMSDIAMGVMINPFYLDLGFSKQEIADISKIFGFFMTIVGASIGGVMAIHWGIMKSLLLGAIMVAITNLLFALLAILEPSLMLLGVIISVDNLSGGIATAVFIAYLSSLTNPDYTATQYALFSSLMTLPAKLIAGFSGVFADSFGYYNFFIYTALMGLPAIALLLILMSHQNKQK